MGLLSKSQSQFELFPKAENRVTERSAQGLNFKNLTVSLENAIVLSIIFLMVIVLCFAFGIERGKNLVMGNDQMSEPKVQELRIATDAIETPEATPSATDVASGNSQPVQGGQKPQVLEIELDKEEILRNIYTIQVASFKLEKNAKQEASKLDDLGHETFVMPKGKYSIVCIGKFNALEEAKMFSEKLKKRYNDCLVRRL